MALRSFGATLLAKAGTGSALRKLEEKTNQGAVPEGNVSAQPNSVSRSNINQPIEIAVPGGTQKQVAVKPQIQPNLSSVPGNVPTTAGAGLVPQMGGAAAAAAANRNINAPIGSPAAMAPISAPSAMRATSSKSSGAGTARAAARPQPMLDLIAPSGVGTTNAPAQTQSTQLPQFSGGSLGNRSSATGDNNNSAGLTRNLFQGVAATIANAIQPGADTRATNPVSKALINYANNPQVAKTSGVMKPLQNLNTKVKENIINPGIGNVLRSTGQLASSAVQNTAKKASNWLRSLFR